MIHANRIVTVGEQESIIDRPIILYRGDREVEIEFTLVGNEFTFSEDGNVIKSVNASHGQLVLNTPSGEHMFSELAECNEGKVVFVVTKEMIDEFVEVGFYSFQIRLYDSAEMKSRVTIPPVMNGFDIRNPIAAEDEVNVVDQGLVDYARIYKDQSNEELPTFDWTGAYNKTEWAHHDVITENKMNKIEDALYSINANVKESDVFMLNALGNIKKDADKYVEEHIAEVEADVEEFERNLNTDVQKFKIDTNAALADIKNDTPYFIKNIDSSANCTSYLIDEFNKAKNNGNTTIYFESGVYQVKNLMFLSNINYIGIGEVIFKSHSDCDEANWDNTCILNNVENIKISNINFDGNKDGVGGNGWRGVCNLRVEHSNNIEISNCKFDNNYYLSILFKGCNHVNVFYNRFYDSDVAVLFMSEATSNANVMYNYIEGGTSEGISIYDCNGYHTDFNIANNTIKNKTNGQSICVKHADRVNINNNNIQNAGTAIGVLKQDDGGEISKNIKIFNNSIEGATFSGIEIQECYNGTIQGNNINNCNQYGILMKTTEKVNIINNDIYNCALTITDYDSLSIISIRNSNNINLNNNIIESSKTLRGAIYLDGVDKCLVSNNYATPFDSNFIDTNNLNTSNVILLNNIGNFSINYMSAKISKNNCNPELDTMPSVNVDKDWYPLIPPMNQDVFCLRSTSEDKIHCNDFDINRNTYLGRVITIIIDNDKIEILNGVKVKLKNSPYVCKEGDVLQFVFIGDKWLQI